MKRIINESRTKSNDLPTDFWSFYLENKSLIDRIITAQICVMGLSREHDDYHSEVLIDLAEKGYKRYDGSTRINTYLTHCIRNFLFSQVSKNNSRRRWNPWHRKRFRRNYPVEQDRTGSATYVHRVYDLNINGLPDDQHKKFQISSSDCADYLTIRHDFFDQIKRIFGEKTEYVLHLLEKGLTQKDIGKVFHTSATAIGQRVIAARNYALNKYFGENNA